MVRSHSQSSLKLVICKSTMSVASSALPSSTSTSLLSYPLETSRANRAGSRVFQEKREGFVSHSAASRYLADSKDAQAGLGMMFDEAYQGFAHTVEAFRRDKNPGPSSSVSLFKVTSPDYRLT